MRVAWLAVYSLAAACGGRARGVEPRPLPASPDDAGAAGIATNTGSAAPTGGAPGCAGPSAAAGAPVGGGGILSATAGAADALPLIAPGTRSCQDTRDCLGLDCVAKAGQVGAMCSVSCADDEACPSNDRCVSGKGLDPACFARCELGTDCSYPFDCFDPDSDGRFVCVPAPWANQSW